METKKSLWLFENVRGMLYNNQNRWIWMSICQCVMFLKKGWKIKKKTHINNSQHLKWDDDMWHFAEWVSFGDSMLHILHAAGSVLWCPSHFVKFMSEILWQLLYLGFTTNQRSITLGYLHHLVQSHQGTPLCFLESSELKTLLQ